MSQIIWKPTDSINSFLGDDDYPVSITRGKAFEYSMAVLASKRKGLKQDGKGKKKKSADPFTDEEIAILYTKGLLGGDNWIPLSFVC